jgi:hypothetical protein
MLTRKVKEQEPITEPTELLAFYILMKLAKSIRRMLPDESNNLQKKEVIKQSQLIRLLNQKGVFLWFLLEFL